MYPADYEAKTEICEYARRLYERGMVAGNDGNLSCRVGENEVWCTPTMESKGYLNPDMLVKVDLDGNVLEGSNKVSSEVKVHNAIYRENPAARCVIHAHPVTATAFACCGKPVPATLLPEGVVLFGAEIGVAPYAAPGSKELADSVRPFATVAKACLMENHGALTWGPDMKAAYFSMETLESYCKIFALLNPSFVEPHDVPSSSDLEMMLRMHDEAVRP